MSRFVLLFLAAALALPQAAAAASPEGVWRTEVSQRGAYVGASMDVRIAPCAEASDRLCGVVVEVYGTDRREPLGQRVLWDLAPAGDDTWRGGKVWVLTRDKVYDARMALEGGRLRVEGCVAIACQGQTWTRVQ